MYSKIQYISQGATAYEQLTNIKKVVDSGGNWIQLRYKNAPESEVLSLALQVKKALESYNCTFIINDYLQIAKHVDANGVHLGLNDMPVAQARSVLGWDKIIGGTANTLLDVMQRHNEQCNYIGLGPFRFTATKQNLSPVLGLQGFEDIMYYIKELQIQTHVYAIGGIEQQDIIKILQTGIYGVALSGYITRHPQQKELFSQLQRL